MSKKTEYITVLYQQKLHDITNNAVAWRFFLHTAAFQYKYSFADQVLIYAQRPLATACAETELWNGYFGRWVKRGATGIALFDRRGSKQYLRYVFDVSDTYQRENKPFDIWGIKPEYEPDVIEALQNRFIDDDKDIEKVSDAVISAVINLGADNITDYLQELIYGKEGSFLEELDEDNLRMRLLTTVQASVVYTVLTRLGYNADNYVGKEFFQWIHEFNTPSTVNILGSATSDISEMCLREIERTVKSVEKNVQREIRTFDGKDELGYNDGGRAEKENENGGIINDIILQDTERSADPELGTARADRLSNREVRSDETTLYEGTPQRNLHDDTDHGKDQSVSSRDRRDGERADIGDYEPTGEEPWDNGADESRESDAVGADDEQYQSVGGGRSVEQSNLRISDSTLPEISDPNSLIQILRHDGYLRRSKKEIVSFLRSDASKEEKVEYVKKAYPPLLFAEFYKEGTEEHLGYRADEEGLLAYIGNFPSRSAEMRMGWEFVTGLINALIKDKNYLDEPLVQESKQLSIFDVDIPNHSERLTDETFPESEYELHLGTTVYIGKDECEIVSLSKDKVELFDGTLIPLELDYDVFMRRVRDNLLNNHLRKDVIEWATEIPKPAFKSESKPKQGRKRKSDEPTIKSLAEELEKEYARWDELLTNGGSDPTWSDGVNMNLVQGRIVADRRRLLEMCGDGEKPAILIREEPPRMSSDYMAKADEIREAARKSLEIYKSNPTYQWCKAQMGPIPAKILKNSLIPNMLSYVSSLEEYIEKGDLVAMRRHRNPERYIDSFDTCKREIEKLLPQIESEQLTDEIFESLMSEDNESEKEFDDGVEKVDVPQSSIWERYTNTKEQFPDHFALIKVGDFYELYEQDALEASAILELTLTGRAIEGRATRVPMCGFPAHAMDKYLQKLLDTGHKVAISEEDRTLPIKEATLKIDTRSDAEIAAILPSDGKEILRLYENRFDEDRFYIDHSNKELVWIQFNLDSSDGGEFLEFNVSFDHIRKVGRQESFSEFFSILEEGSKCYPTDMNDASFHDMAVEFLEGKYDCKGCNDESMDFILSEVEEKNIELERAKEYIREYLIREFDEREDHFENLGKIELAYTTVSDADIPIQADVDLVEYRLQKYLGDVLVETVQFDSLTEMNDNLLCDLDFGVLTDVSDEQIEKYWQESRKEPQQEAVSMVRTDLDKENIKVVYDKEFTHDRKEVAELANHISTVTNSIDKYIEHLKKEVLLSAESHIPVVIAPETEEEKEISDVMFFLREIKIKNIELSYENDEIVGKDGKHIWRGREFYKYLLNDIAKLDDEYQISDDSKVDMDIVDAVIEHASRYGWDIDDEIQGTFKTEENTESIKAFESRNRDVEVQNDDKHNYRITDDEIGMGGAKEKFRKNIDAIKLLYQLEAETRLATPDEQEILAQYSGWGGIADAFDETKDNWHSEYNELKSILSPEEYEAARDSTLTAFFTPPVIIKAMYKAIENMGFKRGNILEPSCGVGNFMGLVPESMDTKMYGVEIDSIAGRIARQLYQKNGITISGYEKTDFPDSFFDIAIGNVPFNDIKLLDKKYDKYNFLIHDYFFAKTLDKIRPGGVIAFITSNGTLDKENPSVRKYIAQRADFIGAIRLPNNTFNGAGAQKVVSDIIFLQKRDRIIDRDEDWVHLGKDENGITMNQYFVDHPDMVLGEMVMRSGPYGYEPTCRAYEDEDIGELLSEAVGNIHAEISEIEVDELTVDMEDRSIPADPTVKNFSFTIVDGKVYYRQNSVMNPVDTSVTGENRIKGLIGIRDTVRALIDAQLEDYPESEIKALQSKLNNQYDSFIKKYGLINSRGNAMVFSDDNSYFLLCSLEILDENKELKEKADMFTKRTIKSQKTVDRVDTASEALALSIGERAMVDMEYMSELTGKNEEELFSDLNGVIFRNPEYGEKIGAVPYIMADEYLSGNVREKLRAVRAKAEIDSSFAVNVEALEKVQPEDINASEIGVRLGSTWIPEEDVQDFMYELLGTPFHMRRIIEVKFIPQIAQWVITGKSRDSGNVKATSVFGTPRINGYGIIEQTLNLKDVRIFDYSIDENGNKKAVLNKKETTIAQGKQEQIKRAFDEWIWKDPVRRERLCKLYNERFNNLRPREFDGSHIKFFGMNPEITLRKHQSDAVARIMYGGNSLLAHVVGAGKTFTMVAAAQESKRLGLCSKSMFVVPNHLIEQWASEYLQLYPSANVLVATKKDFETKNRKKFCARIATGDYDAVIIGHSQFEKIPVSRERQIQTLEIERNVILRSIEEAKSARGDRVTVKQLAKAKKQIETRLAKLNDQSRKDDVVTFEELGVDRLFVDEAHFYKNLAAYTKMRNVAGISQTEAQKSSDLYMKCRYLDELTGGKGCIFATGTPISNTMVELYTMQKYLQYDELQMRGLLNFDAWASTFGETVTAIELAPDGTGYRAKTRFAKFFNIPELISMFKQTADIQTADMLNLPVPEAHYHVVKVEASDMQKELVESFAERAERIHKGMVNSSEDNMLLITNDGRKAALDQRLINTELGDFEGSKVNTCVQNIYEIWEKNTDKKSAQLVFCDLSTPKDDGGFNVYDDIRNKLIERGIPQEEIAFIHVADTDVKKKELFAKVRRGQVRVLLGSTFKMGAGTNVQQRLIALHDLDVPWRPSDLEQRAGRIVRQGNSNPEVDLYRYITEGTFDSYSYQLLESKQKFISQIMTSKSPVRSAEDVDETALSYAEIKALASGNPKIMEKMQLDADVAKLKLQKADHLSQRYRLEDDLIKKYPRDIADQESRKKHLIEDMETAKNSTFPNEKGFSPMVVMGSTYTEKSEAGKAILGVCERVTTPSTRPLGEYRGFKTDIGFDTMSREFFIMLRGALSYKVPLGQDANGIITRLDNAIENFENRKQGCELKLEELHNQVENAKAEIAKPFPRETELDEKCKQLAELNAELDMDKRENEIVDDAEEQSEEELDEKNKSRDDREER